METARSLSLLVIVVLLGCSATGPLYEEPGPVQGSSEALLEIFRPDELVSIGAAFRVFIDDELVVVLKNNGYSRVRLEPGQHVAYVSWWGWSGFLPVFPIFSSALWFETRAGERSVLKVSPGFLSASLKELTPKRASRDLKATRLVPPEIERLE